MIVARSAEMISTVLPGCEGSSATSRGFERRPFGVGIAVAETEPRVDGELVIL